MANVDARLAALQHIPLFAGLSESDLRQLAGTTLYQRFPRGHTIFCRGDPGDRAFIIVDGAIDLIIDSPDGRELILTRLGPGEHFGEMALLDDLLRSATARTAAPTEVVVVLRSTFFEVLDRRPEISRHIIRVLVQRLRSTSDKLETFAYLDAKGRIARTVLDLARIGEEALHVSHEELASMSATSRQTTTRILGEWEESGFVDLSRRGIVLKNPEALSVMAQY